MKKKISLDIGNGHTRSAIESGCERFKIGSWIENINSQIIVNELETKINIRETLIDANRIYSDIIKNTADVLNQFHGVKKSINWAKLQTF